MAENKKKNAAVSLNSDELKGFLTHIVNNNRYLQKNGKIPVATEVVGESGIGKTSAILQLSKEMGLDMVKINLAQIEELGDLVGFPIRQFEVYKEKEESIWIDEHAMEEYRLAGYQTTGQNRMSYCPPEWIANKKRGGILLLDDWNRADIRFIQAVMELIDRQQYISWTLPPDWHIILSANPDDGDYLVNSIDQAQKTRFISANLKFDIECWSRWAENNGIDGRCINFMLKHPEICAGKSTVNARSATMFFNSISSLENFLTALPMIQMIGEGSVGPDFSTLFTTFINNKLDQLIGPDVILTHKDKDWVIKQMKTLVGNLKDEKNDKKYRADIASIISTRIINYCLFLANDKDSKGLDKSVVERLADVITSEIFSSDMCYHVVKTIYNSNTAKFKMLTMNKDLVKYIIK